MTESTIQNLRALARQVQTYQIERDWSDNKLCKEIAQVGSSKTYKRILDDGDDLSELNVENQLRNYQAAVETVNALRTKARPAEPEYEDFSNILRSREAIARVITEDEECVARLVIIEGNTGSGKDAVRRNLQKHYPKITVTVEATELWRDSLAVPAREIYKALNIVKQTDRESRQTPTAPRYPAEIIAEIINALRERKLILLINEAHHMGPRTLNIIKTIINQTPTIVVLECIPALLTRLLSSSYEEAVQLTGNRLCERVYLQSPPPDEILLLLERRGIKFTDAETCNTAGVRMAEEAPKFGNWRFVSQVARRLFELKTAVGPRALAKAISEVKDMRTRIIRETTN